MAGKDRGKDALYRARKSLGERLHRVIQREVPGRVPEPGGAGHAAGGEGADCLLAEGVQHGEAAQLSWLPPAGSGSDLPSTRSELRLTLEVAQTMGAGHH